MVGGTKRKPSAISLPRSRANGAWTCPSSPPTCANVANRATELAKRFGISRRTVYHWIETGQLDRDLDSQEACYRARPPVPTQLDPYKPIIQARLEAFPLLTAQRLFEELRSVGYPGGYTQLKEYVRRVRPHAPVDPVVRFEAPPGYFGTFQLLGVDAMRCWWS